MDFTRQSVRAQNMHSTYLASKEKTCIDCHKGIAHNLPHIPPGQVITDTPGQVVPAERGGEPRAAAARAAMRPDDAHAVGLSVRGLECRRAGRKVFSGLSFEVRPGDVVQVRGANGSGKSSLLRLLCGLLPPSRGEVRWRRARVGAAKPLPATSPTWATPAA